MNEVVRRLQAIEKLLQQQTLLSKEVMNFPEACEYLGISSSHLYKLTSSSQIPHFCPQGKKLYFSRVALNEWMQRNPRHTVADLESEATNYVIRKGRRAQV